MAEQHPARAIAVEAKRGDGKTHLRRSSGVTHACSVKLLVVLVAGLFATGLGLTAGGAARAEPFVGGREQIGLPPLYAALVAVAN